MRLKKSPPPTCENPRLGFSRQCDVLTLSQLFAEHRGKQKPEHRFHALIYSFLIYDHLASAYNHSRGGSEGIGQSWLSLANHPAVVDMWNQLIPSTDQGTISAIEFDLPILSASPIHTSSAPRGITPGKYIVGNLTTEQFASMAWKVRCNLLHGSYDPNDDETWLILRNMSRVFTHWVWKMLIETPR